MPFLHPTETTAYSDRTSVLVECDWIDEHELGRADESALTRLQEEVLSGRVQATPNVLTTIRTLQKKLGVTTTKNVVVLTTNQAMIGRRRATSYNTVILSQPYGCYYRTLTFPWNVYHEPKLGEVWDSNPIDLAQIWNIPSNVKPDQIRSHRLRRIPYLSLHFTDPGFNRIFDLLLKLNFQWLWGLELRNVDASPSQIEALKIRMGWDKNIYIGVLRPGSPMTSGLESGNAPEGSTLEH